LKAQWFSGCYAAPRQTEQYACNRLHARLGARATRFTISDLR
jgi:hypothetical protein